MFALTAPCYAQSQIIEDAHGQVADIRGLGPWLCTTSFERFLRSAASVSRQCTTRCSSGPGRNHTGSPFLRYVAQVFEVVVIVTTGLKATCLAFGACSSLLP